MVFGDTTISAMHRDYKVYIKNQNLVRSENKQMAANIRFFS